MKVLHVLLLPDSVPTITYRAWAQERHGFCLLRWYCERLLQRWDAADLVIACTGQADAEAARSVAEPLGIFVAVCESGSRAGILRELSLTFACPYVLFGLESLFAPTGLIDAVAARHCAGDPGGRTVVADLPALLGPEVIGYPPVGLSPPRPFLAQPHFGACPITEIAPFLYQEDVDRTRQAVSGLGQQWNWEIVERWLAAEYRPEPLNLEPVRTAHDEVRLLFISGGCVYAGAEECLRGLVAELVGMGFSCTALVSAEGLLTERLRAAGCGVIVPNENLTLQRRSRNGTIDWNLQLAHEVIEAVCPAAIHVNGLVDHAFYRAAHESGISVVTHIRSADRYEPEVCASSAAFVAVSQFARAAQIRHGLAGERIAVIPDGVDTKHFRPDREARTAARRKLRIPEHSFTILMLARFVQQKRHDLLIAAAAGVSRIGIDLHIVFAGTAGPPEDMLAIHSELGKEGLAGRASLLNFHEDVLPLISASDVLVLPSDGEALGTSVLEAMAAGIPVVVSDNGGTAELVRPGETGLLMRGGDPASLADALRRLASDAELAARLSEGGRRAACTQFSLRHHARRVADVLLRSSNVRVHHAFPDPETGEARGGRPAKLEDLPG
ncbi:MAG TPA: glycosyltransferase family 4 protein [Bryobacteraceae bacterium]|nr:glycosyltransferase family 4 protein [Bryobacteraceae bacterium]